MEYKSLQDEELLSLYSHNDDEAFNELYSRHHQNLLGYLRGFDRYAAEDIAQDVWLDDKIKRAPENGGYDPAKGSFRWWLKRCIAYYKVKEHIRRKTSKPYLSIENVDLPLSSDQDISEVLSEAESIRTAFNLLYRILFLCAGYPHQQLAFAMAKLVSGYRDESGKIRSNTDHVSQQYGSVKLKRILDQFKKTYNAHITDNNSFNETLSPLEVRLELGLGVLFGKRIAKHLKDTPDLMAGDTTFSSYCPSGKVQSRNISDWCYRLEERIQKLCGSDVIKITEGQHVMKTSCYIGQNSGCFLGRIPPCSK